MNIFCILISFGFRRSAFGKMSCLFAILSFTIVNQFSAYTHFTTNITPINMFKLVKIKCIFIKYDSIVTIITRTCELQSISSTKWKALLKNILLSWNEKTETQKTSWNTKKKINFIRMLNVSQKLFRHILNIFYMRFAWIFKWKSFESIASDIIAVDVCYNKSGQIHTYFESLQHFESVEIWKAQKKKDITDNAILSTTIIIQLKKSRENSTTVAICDYILWWWRLLTPQTHKCKLFHSPSQVKYIKYRWM